MLDGQALNGKLTLGENIADVGGLRMSLQALRKLHESKPDQNVGGFTRDQRFFLAAGQVWCTNAREEYQRLLVSIDPHAPGRYRVNGPLQDSVDFEKAFQCKPGSRMAPANRCEVW